MEQEKKAASLSLEEQLKLYIKLAKEGRLPRDTDIIIASYPRTYKKQEKD